ncbi:MAG: peptidyl-prolyl cis-trans isomerase [Melioribacteraceae bacterium]|nr:peptidyl-prolyl cis-trans isomerase [Melioribacteraceae bacterium]MCF8264470.1 peptidyl-prolyl cis-trans isomerase [Melioribacteraceae bacterium]
MNIYLFIKKISITPSSNLPGVLYPILLCLLFGTNQSLSQNLFSELNSSSISPTDIVAKIGDKTITVEEFFYSYEYGPTFPKRKENSKEVHLEFLINEKLIALEAISDKVFDEVSISSLYNDIQADLATEEMFKEEILSTIEIKESEIDSIVQDKQTEVELKWLFSNDINGAQQFLNSLKEGVSFDSLFYSQINDTVFLDMRSMTSSIYLLKRKNPLLAEIVDTMKAGHYSAPIHVNNEWYIIKVDNIWKTKLTGMNELEKLRFEAKQAAIKSKMDQASDNYVKNLLSSKNPIINKDAFNLLRSYLGKYILPGEKYKSWKLEENLDRALTELGLKRGDEYPGIELVSSDNQSLMLDEFIFWYRNRSLQIKFDESSFNAFSSSIQGLIWRMVRDQFLTNLANEKGYFKNEWVQKQSKWWKDKVAYSAMRQKYANSILMENNEIDVAAENENLQSKYSHELVEKMFRAIQMAKRKYDVEINNEVLNKLIVSESNNPKAVDFYIAKTGGLIPRPPYPTIDNEWVNWL